MEFRKPVGPALGSLRICKFKKGPGIARVDFQHFEKMKKKVCLPRERMLRLTKLSFSIAAV